MKVVLLAAGAGAMYCGACARDAALARGLAKLGHEAVVFPLYTPIRLDGELGAPMRAIGFGGVNAYLREAVPGYSHFPSFVHHFLDRPGVLAWASQFAVRTQAADLGPMTISMLQGLDGKHAQEVAAVARATAAEQPDIVVISNSLLISLAPALRPLGSFRIVCQVQGEDGFLDELPDPWNGRAVELIRRQTSSVDRFLAPAQCHASEMAGRLDIGIDRFDVLPCSAAVVRTPDRPGGTLVLGHLSSIRRAKGLDTLLAALNLLPTGVELRIAGKVLEPTYFREVRRLASPFGNRVTFLGELPPNTKSEFMGQIDAMVLPSRLKESRGLAAIEALAHGKPVVGPSTGVFVELAARCPAVLTHRPDDAIDLARAVAHVLDKGECARLGKAGQQLIEQDYAPDEVARQGAALFQSLLG